MAVSPDLLCSVHKNCRRNVFLCDKSKIHYGDVVYIEGVGTKIVNDTTHSRLKQWVDVLVFSYTEEKKFGVRHLNVYRLEER